MAVHVGDTYHSLPGRGHQNPACRPVLIMALSEERAEATSAKAGGVGVGGWLQSPGEPRLSAVLQFSFKMILITFRQHSSVL